MHKYFSSTIVKQLFSFSFIFMLSSCDFSRGFEKDYYEKVTSIKFPESYDLVAAADNGEYLTIAILDFDRITCKRFIQKNNFYSVDKRLFKRFKLSGLTLLDSAYQKQPDIQNIMITGVSKFYGKVGWTYVIDTVACRLYCQIDYPDYGGN